MSTASHRVLSLLATSLLVITGVSTPVARAETSVVKGEIFCDEGASDPSLTVVYANGEFTGFAQAMEGLDRLARSVPGHLDIPKRKIEFGLAFNYDEGLVDKYISVARLASPENALDHLRRFAYDVDVPVGVLDHVLSLTADAVSLALPLVDKFIAPDSDLWTHVQMYEDYVRRGRRVVVVGHGIGSLYVNRALFYLENRAAGDHIAAVGVGTPAPAVRGPAGGCGRLGCYVNRDDDRVLYLFEPQVVPSNVEGDPDLGGLAHHDFVTAYMGDPHVRRAILDRIKDQVRGLKTPRATVGDGPMKASLRWEAGRDLDLHVFEADRTAHVAYDNPKGIVGQLDKDSREGGDELENYFSHCRRLQEGWYDFGVNFYGGFPGPVKADLHLWLGKRNFHFSTVFHEPLGEDGYLSPPPLASLNLERVGDGWFYYELHTAEEGDVVRVED